MENEFMPMKRYPIMVGLYKGENRILIIPVGYTVVGVRVKLNWCVNISNTEMACCAEIGNSVFRAIEEVKTSPLDCTPMDERKSIWKSYSKYKGWVSFWRNHLCTHIDLYESGEYLVMSTRKSEECKGGYCGCVKEIMLPPESTAEDIGRAVVDVFKAAEEFYEVKNNG